MEEHPSDHSAKAEWKIAAITSTDDHLVARARRKHDQQELRKEAHKRWLEQNPSSIRVQRLLEWWLVELLLSSAILINFALTIYETDLREKASEHAWLKYCSIGFPVFYVMELCLRVYAYGPIFLHDLGHIMDITIVFVDVVCVIADQVLSSSTPGPSALRIFRVMRVFRAVRLMRHFHELYLMMFSLVSTLRAIFWAVVLIFLVLTCCSIIAVELVHPINLEVAAEGMYDDSCRRCPHAFKTVMESNITFIQQILAGDSWGQVTVPIIDKAPWTLFFFVFVLLIVNLGILNLVLTVIVDRASQAQHEDLNETILQKMQAWQTSKENLMLICASLDADASENLTLEELMDGFDSNAEFAHYLSAMDVKRDDLATVFKILDRDRSGEVSYREFVEQLFMLKTQDSHTMLVFVRHHVQHIVQTVNTVLSMMSSNGKTGYVAHGSTSVPTRLDAKSQGGAMVGDGSVRPIDMPVKFYYQEEDICADHIAGQTAVAAPFGTSFPKQSSARKNKDADVEIGVPLRTSRHRIDEPLSAITPASNNGPPSASSQPAACALTQLELEHVRDSIVMTIDTIVRDSLAQAQERVREFTKHPDFLRCLQGLATEHWIWDISADHLDYSRDCTLDI